MPTKLNGQGLPQEYVPAGNGEASGEYSNATGSNKHFKSFKKETNIDVKSDVKAKDVVNQLKEHINIDEDIGANEIDTATNKAKVDSLFKSIKEHPTKENAQRLINHFMISSVVNSIEDDIDDREELKAMKKYVHNLNIGHIEADRKYETGDLRSTAQWKSQKGEKGIEIADAVKELKSQGYLSDVSIDNVTNDQDLFSAFVNKYNKLKQKPKKIELRLTKAFESDKVTTLYNNLTNKLVEILGRKKRKEVEVKEVSDDELFD